MRRTKSRALHDEPVRCPQQQGAAARRAVPLGMSACAHTALSAVVAQVARCRHKAQQMLYSALRCTEMVAERVGSLVCSHPQNCMTSMRSSKSTFGHQEWALALPSPKQAILAHTSSRPLLKKASWTDAPVF
eukprot:1158282-Pelagomonas_calceolata.AAC.16